ncbi:MAG: elongation factor G [Dehalococcoidia bacterium]|nr:elongation factor G [Dehalococcoidia bacterium]
MHHYPADKIRNVVFLSHTGAGKTSLCEALLFQSKTLSRLGKTDEGTSTSDYEPEEIKRKISISASVLPLDWNKTKINLLDTPGYSDFLGEAKSALRVAEAAILVVSAAAGVEVGTELAWKYAAEAQIPRIMFVNKLDRENSDFYKTVNEIRAIFGKQCVPVQLPIGAESAFEGVFDLIRAGNADVPSGLDDRVPSHRESLIEAVAETDDELTTKFLEGEELTEVELQQGLKSGILQGKIVPILAGSAVNLKGTAELMDAICDYLPSPADRPDIVARHAQNQQEALLRPEPGSPLCALVFKTTADPYVGKLTYLRVYSGSIQSDSSVWNANKNRAERIGQLYLVRGKTQEPIDTIGAGDIGAVAKLAETNTNDTLCSKEQPLILEPIAYPSPALAVAVYPKTKADMDKMGAALTRMTEEDATIAVYKDAVTGETILSGVGETHVDVAVEKIKRKFGVDIRTEIPKIPYKETITSPAKAEHKHKKQTGGHGQYGHVLLSLEPLSRGSGSEFAEKVVGGAVPKNYIPAVEKGVNEALQEGVIAGYPVTDVRVTLYDGSYHAVDSSEMSFKLASSQAVKKGVNSGNPALLEPIMNVHITVPDNFTGDVMSDLNGKRARVLGVSPSDGSSVIEAQVPLAEMLRYSTDLRSITQGRGSYSMEFCHYEEVPQHIAQRIISETKRQEE